MISTTAASGEKRQTQAAAVTGGRSSAQGGELVDVEVEPPPVHRDDQPEAYDDLGSRDRHHREREDLPAHVRVVAREGDESEVRAVEHDLDREQDDQRAPPEHHAERPDREQERRDGDVPGEVRAHHVAQYSLSMTSVALGCAVAIGYVVFGSSSRAWLPRMTPPTAAASSTIDVTSNASRWSLRNTRPTSLGLP